MMKIIMKINGRFVGSQDGATAVEYALLAMCIVLGIVVSVGFVGTQLNTSYSEIAGSFS